MEKSIWQIVSGIFLTRLDNFIVSLSFDVAFVTGVDVYNLQQVESYVYIYLIYLHA